MQNNKLEISLKVINFKEENNEILWQKQQNQECQIQYTESLNSKKSKNINQKQSKKYYKISKLAQDFILTCLRRSPYDRKNVFKLLQHPFLTQKQNDFEQDLNNGQNELKFEDEILDLQFKKQERKNQKNITQSSKQEIFGKSETMQNQFYQTKNFHQHLDNKNEQDKEKLQNRQQVKQKKSSYNNKNQLDNNTGKNQNPQKQIRKHNKHEISSNIHNNTYINNSTAIYSQNANSKSQIRSRNSSMYDQKIREIYQKLNETKRKRKTKEKNNAQQYHNSRDVLTQDNKDQIKNKHIVQKKYTEKFLNEKKQQQNKSHYKQTNNKNNDILQNTKKNILLQINFDESF